MIGNILPSSNEPITDLVKRSSSEKRRLEASQQVQIHAKIFINEKRVTETRPMFIRDETFSVPMAITIKDSKTKESGMLYKEDTRLCSLT
jgi:hypothetical protein